MGIDLTERPVKTYNDTIEAIKDYLFHLRAQGKLNTVELERQQLRAGLPMERMLTGAMLRQIMAGGVATVSALRAESFCQLVGIKVYIVNEMIPPNFERPAFTPADPGEQPAQSPELSAKPEKKSRKSTRK